MKIISADTKILSVANMNRTDIDFWIGKTAWSMKWKFTEGAQMLANEGIPTYKID